MTPIHDLCTTTALLISTFISLVFLLVLSYIHFFRKISGHILTGYVKIILISDIIYSIAGVLLYYSDIHRGWFGYIGSIRSYFRVVSIAAAFGFVSMIKLLGLSDEAVEDEKIPKAHLQRIFLFPLVILSPMWILNNQRCSDAICWNGLDKSLINFAAIYIPIALAVGLVIWHHGHVIRALHAKWGTANTISIYDVRELWIYPLGLCFCYLWLAFDHPVLHKTALVKFVRLLDIFGQQGQGLMHCLVFGLSYETRTFIKQVYKEQANYWKIFEEFKEESVSIELQTRLVSGSKTLQNQTSIRSNKTVESV